MISRTVRRFASVIAMVGMVFSSIPARADMAGAMSDFFGGSGTLVNATAPGAYKGQSAGYYSGGGLYVRTPIEDTQLSTMQLPSMQMGCGGIDLYAGGFSFVNSDQLIAVMKAIGNNALSMAFMLGIETISPIIAEKIEDIRGLMQQVNSMDINSCEAASALVNGIGGAITLADANKCASYSGLVGLVADHFEARQGCSNQAEFSARMNGASTETKEFLVPNINLAWRVINDGEFAGSDDELKEMMMTISGTIIKTTGSTEAAPGEYKTLPSKAGDEEFLRGLLDGTTEVSIYACDEMTECLHPVVEKKTLGADKGFYAIVDGKIKGLLAKFEADQIDAKSLDADEIAFLNSMNFPLYKLLNVYSTYSASAVLTEQEQLKEIVAIDLLTSFLGKMLGKVEGAPVTAELTPDMKDEYRAGIRAARAAIGRLEAKVNNRANMALRMIERTQFIEGLLAQKLTGRIGAVVANTEGS